MRGTGDLAGTVRGVHEALLAAGWSLEDPSGDGTWLRATRGDLLVDVTVFTVDASDTELDPAFTAGQTQVSVRSG